MSVSQPRIFISYRRAETDGAAQLVHTHLASAFGAANVFMDEKGLSLGDDYRKQIVQRLSSCDAMVVVVGHQWLGTSSKGALSRLHEPGDYIEFEVSMALNREILVLPVLVNGAHLPEMRDLPDTLWELHKKQRVKLTLNERPEDAIARVITEIRAKKGASVEEDRKGPVKEKKVLWLALGAVVACLVAFSLWSHKDAPVASMGEPPHLDSIITPAQSDIPANKGKTANLRHDSGHGPETKTSSADDFAGNHALPCSLNGTQFVDLPLGKDELTVVELDGRGRYQVSGTLRNMSVSGLAKASGNMLIIVPSSGANLVGGSLSLDAGCAHLKGGLTMRSALSGGSVTVPIDLHDRAKGR